MKACNFLLIRILPFDIYSLKGIRYCLEQSLSEDMVVLSKKSKVIYGCGEQEKLLLFTT